MPRVTVPPGTDPLVHVWGTLAPPLTSAAGAYTHAVYTTSQLSLREFEAARITVARLNACAICTTWRTARDVPGWSDDPGAVSEEFYDRIGRDPDYADATERERLAAEFAERYVSGHEQMDDALWERLHAAYSDDELVDLALCVASWLALGRFNRVFDLDGACRAP